MKNAIIGFALVLSGCVAANPTPPQQRLTPRISEAVTTYNFTGCTAEVSAAERQRLRGFLQSLPLSSEDTIIVSIPRAGTPQRDSQRVQTIRQLFTNAPAQTRVVAQEDFSDSQCQSSGIVRLVRVAAVEIDCRDGASATGCATARNMAAMMANPADMFMPSKIDTYMPPTGTILRFEDSED